MKHPVALAILAVLVLVLVTAGGFMLGQTRVIERAPNAAESAAMITVEDLVGETPAVAYTPELLVRVFPSMPMLWLNYRRGGDVEMRSHLLRYDDVDLANTGVERFAAGDSRWLEGLPLADAPLPRCIDAGRLRVAPGQGFVLVGRHGGAYVHVSATGWAPDSPEALAERICPSLDALDALPWPPL